MAEGHLVVRWAIRLRSLVGEPLDSVHLPSRYADRAWLLKGQSITAVDTHGKHLLIRLSDDQTIHCHALMYGSWQIGKRGMALRKDESRIRLRLLTPRHDAVFFNGPVVEILTEEELAGHRVLKALGPDIMGPGFDRDRVWKRAQAAADRELGDLVLDQEIIAGVGNIYKSEGLFLAGMDPLKRAKDLSRKELESVWEVLIPLMWKGARSNGPITTLPRNLQEGRVRNWVYRRSGKPCFRCGETIKTIRQGRLPRTTYFCPKCQK